MALKRMQQVFADQTILHPNIKKTISSKTEWPFKKILTAIGQEGKDWFHQSAFIHEEEGLVAVSDFVFPKEKLIIELDGADHKERIKRERDKLRDRVFYSNDFSIIRIPTPIPKEKEGYWKIYIEETLKICQEEMLKAKPDKKIKKRLFTDKEFIKRYLHELNSSKSSEND